MAAVVPADTTGVKPGPVRVQVSADTLGDLARRRSEGVARRFLARPGQAVDHRDLRGGRPQYHRTGPADLRLLRRQAQRRVGPVLRFPGQPSGRHTQPRRFQTDRGASQTSKAAGSDIAFDGLTLGIFHGSGPLLLLSGKHADPAARHRDHERAGHGVLLRRRNPHGCGGRPAPRFHDGHHGRLLRHRRENPGA